MEYLLDTHAMVWFIYGDNQLSSKAHDTIKPNKILCYVSIASVWEIAIKVSSGKLDLKSSFSNLEKLLTQNNFTILPITFEDTLQLTRLPFHHKDPFDRIIISQSLTNNLTIITKDEAFKNYDVKLLW